MFNSGIGIFELALIAGVALMLLGPEKFPGFAKVSIRTFRDIKKYMSEAQREIAKELNPMKDEFDKIKKVDVEGYVDKLIGEDKTKTTDDEDEDDENFEYNVEPDPSVIDDWYPEDEHLMAGDDETANEEEDSSQEVQDAETVPYQDSPSTENEKTIEDEFEDDTNISNREEVVNAENPERLEN